MKVLAAELVVAVIVLAAGAAVCRPEAENLKLRFAAGAVGALLAFASLMP